MARGQSRKIAFISSFVPRRCGIATFTADLIAGVKTTAGESFEPLVAAMQSDNGYQYNDPVKFEIRRNLKSDYVCAADYINFSHIDIVSLQHEFGLFGGEAGSYLSLLLNRLNVPIITTLHTILDEPPAEYYKAMVDVCEASYKVVVMNKRGVPILRDVYGTPHRKIEVIPHGVPDLPFVDSNYYKHKFGMEDRKTILTFGLLNRNKGIEVMLSALPKIVQAHPSVLYIILGMTHPQVKRQEGESYRLELQRMVKELGIQENVIFHNRFVNDDELRNFLCAADVYVTPYLRREQMTSGTLAFAVGAGKVVVSTPYWAAEELLAEGRGKLVPFGNWHHITDSIIEILGNDSLFYSMRRRAYDFSRTMIWPKAGREYWKLFGAKHLPVRVPGRPVVSQEKAISITEVPEPSLDHLKKLTDDTGIYQHAQITIPNRDYGYCTDDNARAVIAAAKYHAQYADSDAIRLFDIYLSFICHAQNSDGTIRNLMSFDRQWMDDELCHDALGRALWAFGTAIATPPSPSYLSIIKDCFDKSAEHVSSLWPRGMAYSIFGMADYLRQFPGASDIKRLLATAADKLVSLYEINSGTDWHWFEDTMTYDNAVLPQALFVAFSVLEEEKYLDIARQSCKFLLANTFNGSHFSFIGCNGWYKRGGQKANFDQQPIEAASTVMMLRAAFEATRQDRFLTLARKAFDWFLGENDLHIPVYDFRTKGCCDGLKPEGVNLNQGAESTLSFLLGLLCIVESYTSVPENAQPSELAPAAPVTRGQKARFAIKDMTGKSKGKKPAAEKLT